MLAVAWPGGASAAPAPEFSAPAIAFEAPSAPFTPSAYTGARPLLSGGRAYVTALLIYYEIAGAVVEADGHRRAASGDRGYPGPCKLHSRGRIQREWRGGGSSTTSRARACRAPRSGWPGSHSGGSLLPSVQVAVRDVDYPTPTMTVSAVVDAYVAWEPAGSIRRAEVSAGRAARRHGTRSSRKSTGRCSPRWAGSSRTTPPQMARRCCSSPTSARSDRSR